MSCVRYLIKYYLPLQALVVLVHDLGANWELISDAINSTLQLKVITVWAWFDWMVDFLSHLHWLTLYFGQHLKCISRNSKECKERHNILMDRNTGDGADSAEDSGSSQPYPSTLPGIPEASFILNYSFMISIRFKGCYYSG